MISNEICLMKLEFPLKDVSVFVLEKKLLDSYDKREREPILEMFRKGPQQLAKLRHPRVLTVQHTLEESRWVKLSLFMF